MTLKKLGMAFYTFLLGILFCGCTEFPIEKLKNKREKISFTVEYCYHMPQTGNAMTLWNGCYPFLSSYEVGTENLIAGDVIEVEFTGVMFMLESFPGQIRTENFVLKNVAVQLAKVSRVTYVLKNGVETVVEETTGTEYPALEYVLTNIDGAYTEIGVLQPQTQLYASYHAVTGELSALYTYNPKA